MNKPLAVIIVIVVGMLGFLTIYSQTGKVAEVEKAGYSQEGHGTQPGGEKASGGYGAAPAPASGGYGAAPAAGGYGAAPATGGYGTPPPKAGGYGAPPPPKAGGYGAPPPAPGR